MRSLFFILFICLVTAHPAKAATWDEPKDEDSPSSKKFFLQHVALESFYHLGKGADLALLQPFTNTEEHHAQISACRAISRIDSPQARELLLEIYRG